MHQRNFSSISIQHHFPSYVICWCLTWLSELEQKARRNSITFQITSEIEFINQWTLLSIPSSFKMDPTPKLAFICPVRFDSSSLQLQRTSISYMYASWRVLLTRLLTWPALMQYKEVSLSDLSHIFRLTPNQTILGHSW